MRAAFLFPSSQAARFIAGKLLETGHDVVFYCPEDIDLEEAENMIFELNFMGMEQNTLRQQEDSFVVQKDPNLTDCDLISKLKKVILSNSRPRPKL